MTMLQEEVVALKDPGESSPAHSAALDGTLDQQLGREWLLTNRHGGFASGTVIGCPTRRYHGLLNAPRLAPLGRHVLLATVLDQVTCGNEVVPLSTFEFSGSIHPEGYHWLRAFEYNLTAADPWVQFTCEHERFEARRRITLTRDAHVARINYTVKASKDEPIRLEVSPLLALRSIHHLRHQPAEDPWLLSEADQMLWAQLRFTPDVTLAVLADPKGQTARTDFHLQPIWWHNFRYRVELGRGFPAGEDLQNVGTFEAVGVGELGFELTAVGMAQSPVEALEIAAQTRPNEFKPRPPAIPTHKDPVRTALCAAADQFVVSCQSGGRAGAKTIIAGYPWFTDWGRDALLSLEGLLLIPGRFEDAREVLCTFAGAQRNGLIPNRFNADACDYNSVDASLWFMHAADAYVRYSGDDATYRKVLLPACRRVVESFVAGTDFDIRVEADTGLVYCGNDSTQITWMDAKTDGTVFTARHGAPVEVNALWYSGLCNLRERAENLGEAFPGSVAELIAQVEASFEPTFWNPDTGCLYDCVRGEEKDPSLRPNQILAVSLLHSPLRDQAKRLAVVKAVQEHLLTPRGLRTLAPGAPGYHGQYRGTAYQRDGAYHTGTAWAWLIGPFVEAYLRVHDWSPEAKAYTRGILEPLLEHLHGEAGLGSISEIFDGDPPHQARGCFAQAWSVAEVLRAYDLTQG